jgi:hypothetical protein
VSYETALQLAQISLAALKGESGQPLTRESIADQVDQLLMLPSIGLGVDRERLIGELEERFTVWTDDAQTLHGDDDHHPWLAARNPDIDWRFWDRYRLRLGESLPAAGVENVDKVTNEVLGELEDPLRDGPWDRRGLVMGNVQSGKTANYTGLICKAADAGYKVIIVLAGMHNNLRSQTQIRLDEGFLGYKSVRPTPDGAFERTGVGLLDARPKADSVTNRTDTGDFNRTVARQFGIHPGGNPLLFVVKKNVSVLQNLLAWIRSSTDGADSATGRKLHTTIPLLVIDDEADQASVDTSEGAFDEDGNPDPEHSPTRINQLIRSLLAAFAKSAYVGYTATPFANIFIHERAETRDLGEDLFPRSFIINLPPPSNYTGAAEIFGTEADEERNIPFRPPSPIIRLVADHAETSAPNEEDGWMPPKLADKTEHIPMYQSGRQVPPSLRNAILSFILSTAVRDLREPLPQFNSMLIHVVRFTKVQSIVKEEVEQALKEIQGRLTHGDGARRPTIFDELRTLWEDDYVPTSAACGAKLPEWNEVEGNLTRCARAIQVRIINGSAKDSLDYEEHRHAGLSLIAIGGDKLSRGLTLEGLTVSYFLRSSRMYDTLMQMGRWFGYRRDYLDVCRLFTAPELVEWFSHIAFATEELRAEFEHMFQIGAKPRDYGLKVRSHPAMLVTSAVKMRSGTTMRLSYSGAISETIIFDESDIPHNCKVAVDLLRLLGAPQSGTVKGGFLWRAPSREIILQFLAAYRSHPDALRADTRLLVRYIEEQVAQGELIDWNVFLASSHLATTSWKEIAAFGLEPTGLIQREAYPESKREGRHSIRRLVSPADEGVDLSAEELGRALEETTRYWEASIRKNKSTDPPTEPSARGVRAARPKERGLLLIYPLDGAAASLASTPPIIGIAISFPRSDTARDIEYTVNNVFAETGDYGGL